MEGYDHTDIDQRDPLVGTVLDRRFRIDFQLAAGGFGAIYGATDELTEAQVALKVLLPQVASDPMVVARFRREGKTLASLRDPHTVTAYELGEAPDGTLYIVMELLHGESLYTRYRNDGAMPWRRVLHIAAGVCSSLAEAHALGVVHRDLKPANIHLETRDGDPDFVKVLDFGIAKIVQGSDVERTQLTQTGQMIGTVDYMSPEQMVGGELTPASDIYTLGVVIYEMIAGRTPFADAQTPTAILAAVLTRTPEPLSSFAQVPPALDRILARCLARDPQHRYTEIGDLAEALGSVATTGPVRWAPEIPTSGFETVHTTEATRIDVRFSASSQPVLDARGARRRLPEGLDGRSAPPPPAAQRHEPTPPPRVAPGTPPPQTPPAQAGPALPAPPMPARVTPVPRQPTPAVGTVAPGRALGSQQTIDVSELPPSRSAHPTPPPGWPPPVAGGPPPPGFVPTPLPGFAPPQPPPPQPPPPLARLPLAPMTAEFAAPVPVDPAARRIRSFPIESTVGGQTYSAPSYDMIAATRYDKLVRRIIWIAVLIAISAAILIATH